MGAIFKHFINEVLLEDEPDGWENFVINIVRDRDAQALIVKFPITLKFIGDGFNILKDKFDEPQGYCEDFDYRVEKSCDAGFTTLFRAKIFISKIEFNLNKKTAESQIEDNSFFARVFNNKSLPATIDVGKSKNDVVITTPTAIDLTLFTPSTGADLPDTREVYDVKDVFTFLTQWMSDGEIGFRSDFYDNLADDESTSIATGTQIRTFAGVAPTLSFDELFQDQRKLYNLLMTIETDPDGSVFLRVEDDEFFFGSGNTISLTDLDDMIESVIEEDLFSSVKFGSEGSGTIGTFPQFTFQSWNDEEFIISGQCNSDNQLDLTIDSVTNSNVIEAILGGDDDFDDDIVFIQYTKSTSAATKTNPQNNIPADTIYNEQYLNSDVSVRYDLQGNITRFLGDGDDEFQASNTVDVIELAVPNAGTITEPFPYDDDFTPPNFDPNGNYTLGPDFRYTFPLTGVYTFQVNQLYRWDVFGAGMVSGTVQIRLKRFDAGDVLQETLILGGETEFAPNPAPNTPYTINRIFGVNGNATDYIIASPLALVTGPGATGDLRYLTGSTYAAIATDNGGGLFEEKDIDEYRIIKVSFDRAMDAQQIKELTDQPFKSVTVDHDGVTQKITFVDDVNINAYKGITNWQMIRNINNA